MNAKKETNERTNEEKKAHTHCIHTEATKRHQFPPSASNITNTHYNEIVPYCIGSDGKCTRLTVCIETSIETLKNIFRSNRILCVSSVFYSTYRIICTLNIFFLVYGIASASRTTKYTTNFPIFFPFLSSLSLFRSHSLVRAHTHTLHCKFSFSNFYSRNAACVLRYVDKQSAIRSRKTRYDGRNGCCFSSSFFLVLYSMEKRTCIVGMENAGCMSAYAWTQRQ